MIVGEGNRSRPFYWQRWLWGVTDPRQNALSEMYDLMEKFRKKKEISVGGDFPLSKFRNARYAAQNGNYEAFLEWKTAYLKTEGATEKKFSDFLRRMDPVASGLNRRQESEFEKELLNDQQRIRLKQARDYAKKLNVILWQWWLASKEKQKK